MRTLRQILDCKGYYYNVRTGDILRNIGTGEARCWTEGSWTTLDPSIELDLPQFELISTEVALSFETVQHLINEKYGPSVLRRFINRQTALQADGNVITEEANMTLNAPAKVTDPVCRMEINPAEAAGKSEYQGHTYYFCNPSCKRQFHQNPQQYADRR